MNQEKLGKYTIQCFNVAYHTCALIPCVWGGGGPPPHERAIAFLFLPGLPFPYIHVFPLQNLLHIFPCEVFFKITQLVP